MRLLDVLMAPRKAAEAKRLRERQQETRTDAFAHARDLAEAAGPEAIAAEYGFEGYSAACAGCAIDLAQHFARAAFNPEAQPSAMAGALEGFARRRRARA